MWTIIQYTQFGKLVSEFTSKDAALSFVDLCMRNKIPVDVRIK